MFGLQSARRLAKPKIYDLVGFSLRGGGLLALAGEVCSRWRTVVYKCSTRLGSTGDPHYRYLADSRVVGLPAWCRIPCDRYRIPPGLELYSLYPYQETAAVEM